LQRKAETSPEAVDSFVNSSRYDLERHLLRGKPEDLDFVKAHEISEKHVYAYKTPTELNRNIRRNPYDLESRLIRGRPEDLDFIIDHHPTHLGARAIRNAHEDLEWAASRRYQEVTMGENTP